MQAPNQAENQTFLCVGQMLHMVHPIGIVFDSVSNYAYCAFTKIRDIRHALDLF